MTTPAERVAVEALRRMSEAFSAQDEDFEVRNHFYRF